MEDRKKKSPVGIAVQFLGIVLMLIPLVIALLMFVPKIMGYQEYTVVTGSMEPKMPVGSLVFVKEVEPETLREGDVITYEKERDGSIITHRVVEISKEDGTVTTKGDANEVEDAVLVHNKNVLGVPVLQIPLLGYLAFYIQRPPGLYIALVVGTLLLAAVIAPTFNRGKEKTASKKEK